MADAETESSAGPALSTATEWLRLTPSERRDRGVSADDVREAFVTVVREGDQAAKQLSGVTLPALDLSHHVLDAVDTHPVDLSGASIGRLTLTEATVRVPLILDEAEIEALEFDYTIFEHDVTVNEASIGSLSGYETRFRGNAEFEGATVTGPVQCQEARFEDDVYFDDVTFEDDVAFSTAAFYGSSNLFDDNSSFRRAEFRGEADFRQVDFEVTHFEGSTFHGPAQFTEASFDGDTSFSDVDFEATANFDETRCDGDIRFDGVRFEADATFRGVAYTGGARNIEDDLTFEGTTFEADADFEEGQFRYTNFTDVEFTALAQFQECAWTDDADFLGVTFGGKTDFDEARFGGDADFSESRFEDSTDFRGAEFRGSDNHLDKAATFTGVDFDGDADFDNAVFKAAEFVGVVFGGLADFQGADFRDSFVFDATQRTNDAYVNLTGASLRTGRIVQPEGGWVRYDLTRASLGSVRLDAETESDHKELLDYFRFCETDFDGFDNHDFDFGDHTDYLDRNRWTLHEFDSTWSEYDPTVPLVPASIERTYLKAKIAASSVGNRQAAGEFRVKRQQYARRKYWAIAGDAAEGVGTRLRNTSRALENLFLGITCGHGLRLGRILVVFALFPILPALVYTYAGVLPGVSAEFFATTGVTENRAVVDVGQALTDAGIEALFANLTFSYITFLTVGYGNASPEGGGANIVAAGSVYVGVVLSGLVLYALIKRSEV